MERVDVEDGYPTTFDLVVYLQVPAQHLRMAVDEDGQSIYQLLPVVYVETALQQWHVKSTE